MAVIVVAGTAEGAGATTVAVGLAHRLAYSGQTVHLARLVGDERAVADAELFAGIEFATATGTPTAANDVSDADGVVTVVEAPVGAGGVAVAAELGWRLVTVGPDVGSEGDASAITTHAASAGPLRLAEDRLLAAPSVATLIEASRARVLARSAEGDRQSCPHIVLGPVASDPSEPHFERFPGAAVITRAEKVDIALAALRSDIRCLILSGGSDPSPYLLDYVASARTVTLLVAPEGTVETARDIEGSFGTSPFAGEEKIERAGELMAAAINDAALAGLIS